MLFVLALFSSAGFSAEPGDPHFYTLAQKWEKANAAGVTRKDAVDRGFGYALQNNLSSSLTPTPTAPDLNRNLEDLAGAERLIEIEQGQSLYVKAREAVLKFIATDEGKVLMETIASDKLRIVGSGIGITFIHVWTPSGRSTFQLRVTPQKFLPTARQVREQEALEKSRTFRLGYNNSRNAFYTGERYREIARNSLNFTQNFSLEGDTPYGAFSSHAETQKSRGKTLLTDGQALLRDGKIGPLKNFDVALGDSRVTPGLLALPGMRIRGVDAAKWNQNKTTAFHGFYGREQASVIGTLTPGIETKRTLNSYLRGGILDHKINDGLALKGGFFKGTGDSRSQDLPKQTAGLSESVRLGPHLFFNPETDYDSRHFAHKDALTLKYDKWRMRGEFRNVGKKFETLIGAPSQQGEVGGLLEANANPFENVNLAGSLDVFRDRLIVNPENRESYNVHTELSLSVVPWEGSTLRLNYQDTDDTARLGPTRQRSYGTQFSQRADLFGHRGNFFGRYQNRTSRILNNSTLDYINDQINFGYQTEIFWGINFSISDEFNFLNEYNLPATSTPRALTYNLDRSGQIPTTPFYYDLRLRIRDEEDTESINSFMLGYDTTEISGGLYYRGFESGEFFLTGSLQSYRQESQNITAPRVEAQFLTGVKYLWDTKLQWSAVGSFQGYVYKDLNGDGQRQAGEPGLEGLVVVASGSQRHAVTDKQGFYDLKSVAGKKVVLALDASKAPYGYAPTTSLRQEVTIEQGVTRRVDFGLTPRSEIAGIVFNDLNGNGKYDLTDKGVRKVRLKLEDGQSARSNAQGSYSFPTVIAGDHTLALDFSTLPEGYLPAGLPKSSFTVFEGIRFELNFPLQAQRQITGRVYLDLNSNKRPDADEKVFTNVRVLFAGQAAMTDKDGWYLFDKLPAGAGELSVDETTLPEGYTAPEKTSLVLSDDPITIPDANIALKIRKI